MTNAIIKQIMFCFHINVTKSTLVFLLSVFTEQLQVRSTEPSTRPKDALLLIDPNLPRDMVLLSPT